MKSARPKLSLVVLVLAGMVAFALAGHIAATRFIHDQQARQLDELTEVVLRRSEFAVDFATASLDELAGRGLATCAAASLQAIRLHVYQRSAVKDVRLVNSDGSVICSAYSETLEFDKGWVDRADMLASRDSKLMLFRVEQFGGDALGVLRDIGDNKALVAILGINSSLFDIMPAELRAHGEVLLALKNGAQLGKFALEADKTLAHPIDFEKSSARYPLRAVIRIDKSVLSTWNSEVYWPAMAVAVALGMLFGVLLSRTRRMEGPVADLDRALARGEFKPYFQPIFDLRTGDIRVARFWRAGCAKTARWCRR